MKSHRLNILLVDDDIALNFVHRKILQKAGVAFDVISKEDAEDGILYLKDRIKLELSLPDLIFLDINMPGMDGWEFLEEYRKLDKTIRDQSVLVMLSSSLDPEDRILANSYQEVASFIIKPLTFDKIDLIMKLFFDS
ncbi:response regulator [Algoriphagus vanfongensis]|uniref:response regulator n=1 Tax=Algoriphagus vanfongensis TaxID=426371 RepID=UPI0004267BA1|nr:response regulator [Algoriphagus vanfongensis]